MANRRCFQSATRYLQSIKSLTSFSQSLAPTSTRVLQRTLTTKQSYHTLDNNFKGNGASSRFMRHFCSKHNDSGDEDDEEDYESGEEGAGELGSENETAVLSAADKEQDAAEIGYTVMGPLQKSDRVFKPYEPVFAVVQIGSHQFKVSNRDTIYAERLKHCDVNDKLVLNKVLMLGSETQTIIGRPILPNASVHAVVEEHALDAKVIIFKKKRRKNYRRKNGHRQELTKLRITDIQGIAKPENITPLKTEKKVNKENPVKVAVGA